MKSLDGLVKDLPRIGDGKDQLLRRNTDAACPRKHWHFVLAPLLCLLLISTASAADVHRIGVSLPLSGENEIQGKAMLYGLQLYFDLLNGNGGVNGDTFELAVRDDRNDPAQARQVAQELADDPKVLAVIGHQFSSVALAAGEVYAQRGLVNLSPSASNPAVTRNSPWAFSMNYHDNLQGEFVAVYLKAVMGITRVLVIHTDDAYGDGLRQSFAAKSERIDLDIVKTVAFSEQSKFGDNFVRDQIDGITTPFDGIVLFTHTDDGVRLVQQIRQSGSAVPVIGPDAFGKASFIKALGGNTANLFVTSPFLYELASVKTKRFVDLYTENYYATQRVRHTLWSAFVYDAAYLLTEAIRHAGPDRAAIRDHLAGIQSPDNAVNGITGDLYFDNHGAMQRQVVISMIENGAFKPAYEQLRLVREAHVLNSLQKKTAADEVIVVDGTPFYRTQVVYTGLDFYRINNIDVSVQRFDVEFFLWFKWMNDVDVDNIDFLNSIFAEENQKEILREDLSGPIKYVAYKVKNAFLTPYDLRSFPFDTQRLPMTLSHKSKDANQLMLVVDGKNLSAAKLTRIYPEEWHYLNRLDYSGTHEEQSTFGDPNYTGNSKVEFSIYESNIIVKRILLPYLLTLFLPLAILILITLLLFIIPVDQFDARLTIVMTALLSVLVFHLAQGDSLPNVGYLIKADIYFMITYLLMFALIINTVVVNRMSRADKLPHAIQLNRWFSWIFVPIAAAAFWLLTALSL